MHPRPGLFKHHPLRALILLLSCSELISCFPITTVCFRSHSQDAENKPCCVCVSTMNCLTRSFELLLKQFDKLFVVVSFSVWLSSFTPKMS